jgi:hypothetical protein
LPDSGAALTLGDTTRGVAFDTTHLHGPKRGTMFSKRIRGRLYCGPDDGLVFPFFHAISPEAREGARVREKCETLEKRGKEDTRGGEGNS